MPAEDPLSVVGGIVGAYPNTIFQLDTDELTRFVRAVQRLAQRFAIRRTDPRFWAVSDAIHAHWQRIAPREATILDYCRLENR